MQKNSYRRYRFPPEIIHQAIWLYLRFTLSLRDVEDLLAERGVAVFYEPSVSDRHSRGTAAHDALRTFRAQGRDRGWIEKRFVPKNPSEPR
jgi:transposase-like protein